MSFDSQSPISYFTSDDKRVKICKDTQVRLRIVGTRVDSNDIVCNFKIINMTSLQSDR